MDNLPPNDPNRNNNVNFAKEDPFDGGRNNGRRNGQGGEPMDVLGDMRDSPAVVVMFLVGVASWFLRERCIC